MVDNDARTIERWTAASEFPKTMRDTFRWAPDAAYPPLIMTADDVFGPALENENTHHQAHDDK